MPHKEDSFQSLFQLLTPKPFLDKSEISYKTIGSSYPFLLKAILGKNFAVSRTVNSSNNIGHLMFCNSTQTQREPNRSTEKCHVFTH